MSIIKNRIYITISTEPKLSKLVQVLSFSSGGLGKTVNLRALALHHERKNNGNFPRMRERQTVPPGAFSFSPEVEMVLQKTQY